MPPNASRNHSALHPVEVLVNLCSGRPPSAPTPKDRCAGPVLQSHFGLVDKTRTTWQFWSQTTRSLDHCHFGSTHPAPSYHQAV
eukprot:454406-Karenia_brevis.AAC.1